MHTALLKPEDVARKLNIHRSTVCALARTGQIDAMRVGKLWRFTPQAVDIYLARLQAKPIPGVHDSIRHLRVFSNH